VHSSVAAQTVRLTAARAGIAAVSRWAGPASHPSQRGRDAHSAVQRLVPDRRSSSTTPVASSSLRARTTSRLRTTPGTLVVRAASTTGGP
jgi:hypothetical protein